MSILTWKEEFCNDTDLEKWIGLRPENLAKHGVTTGGSQGWRLTDDERIFRIDASTCMLCELYLPNPIFDDEENEDDKLECPDCPIYKSTGTSCNTSSQAPYGIWVNFRDPEPMIEILTSLKDSLPIRNDEVNNGDQI